VRHVRREVLKPTFPVHVIWRMQPHVWSLRAQRSISRLRRAFWMSAHAQGYRLVHYAVMGNHVHLLIEAADEKRLTKGMQSLGIRIAKALNRMMGTEGPVMWDRYFAKIQRTPTETARTLNYLRENAHHHYGHRGPDREFTSQSSFMTPQTWYLRRLEPPRPV
jgi:putative transposase